MKRLLLILTIAVMVIPVVSYAQQPTPRPAPVMSAPAPAPVMASTPAPTPKETVAATDAKKEEVKAEEKKEENKKQDSWWKVLVGGLIQILLLFVLAISTGIGGLLIKWLAKKMKITDQEQIKNLESLFDLLVTGGVNYANQMAKKLNDDPDAKAKRMKWALDFVQKGIEDWNLPQKTADWLKKKIEAKIGETK